MLVRLGACVAFMGAMACRDAPGEQRGRGLAAVLGSERPDEPPVMVNKELPFRYPAPLYARRIQANVMLRLYIDRDGRVIADSTRVEESSGHGSLDSAAVKGSQELYFIPAKLHGEPLAVTVLFPVYFRHPEAAPLPGDTILGRREEAGGRRDSVTPPASRQPPRSKTP
jgi:TonB family protein